MCGEHRHDAVKHVIGRGSSPHVRGARTGNPSAISMSGIIPACAGSTHRSREYYSAPRDHPRMCGEHSSGRHELCHGSGSSPHVRGAPVGRVHRLCPQGSSPHVRGALIGSIAAVLVLGIIPACAGSTLGAVHRNTRSRDHPRMCGEHFGISKLIPWSMGSSPHVRGALGVYLFIIGVPGIIPACAGSTPSVRAVPSEKGDHPRMCGEHTLPASSRGRISGSSPHVRGALKKRPYLMPADGIIPACAGSTQGDDMTSGKTRGSSPHVRGALGVYLFIIGVPGIIPACAGSTGLLEVISLKVWDHPRMCGEHRSMVRPVAGLAGSSPHVRGALVWFKVRVP